MSTQRDIYYYRALTDEEFVTAASWPPQAYTEQELAIIRSEIERRMIDVSLLQRDKPAESRETEDGVVPGILEVACAILECISHL
jgi:hypothetical protein